MPRYHTHEVFASLFTIPLTYLYYKITRDLGASAVFFISIIFGVFFLSPDLDTKSKAYRRWSFLRFIWIPYMKLVKHRSFLSHFPVVSSIIRSIYLTLSIAFISALIIYFLTAIFVFLGVEMKTKNFLLVFRESFFSTVHILLDIDLKFLIAFLIGISSGDTIHMVIDLVSTKIKRT